MSEKLCTLRTKGGGGGGATYTETVLWTNSAPTSDFAAQTITLSDGMSNYKYLAIAFKAHKTSTDTVRTIISVEDLGKLESSLNKPLIRFAGTNSTPTSVSRQFLKVSDTTISIGGGYYTNTSGSSNSYAIPTEILGLNELAQGKIVDYAVISSTVGANNASTSRTYTSNSNVFTVSADGNYNSSTITVLEDGLYTYTAIAQVRGSGTASVSIGSQTVATQQGVPEASGEIQISANTVCTVSCGNISNVAENAVLTLLKKS